MQSYSKNIQLEHYIK